jgi:hypothetical protein
VTANGCTQRVMESSKMEWPTLAEHCLEIARQSSTVVNRAVGKHGSSSLASYLQTLPQRGNGSLQKSDDLLEMVYRYAAPLLGESIARQAVADLAEYPVVLTANHHGVDSFAQSIQGSLIFALPRISGAVSARTVTIFACGNIPLNNLTYPRGLLLYHLNQGNFEVMPRKLAVFPDRLKRVMVSVASGFDRSLLAKTQAGVRKLVEAGEISPRLAGPLNELLSGDCCAPPVLELPDYSRQSVVVNNRLWRRLFAGLERTPEMVCLELEKIVGMLLERDLLDSASLAWCVLFDGKLREQVLQELDGRRACWSRDQLARRSHIKTAGPVLSGTSSGHGTIFFWGMDAVGRRIPLSLEADGRCGEVLRGIDDSGKLWQIAYEPRAILAGLRENKLLPSLFTCFLVVAFARSINCAGGYFQAEYLPMMQAGVVAALNRTHGYQDVADAVRGVPTQSYLSGMLAVMARMDRSHLVPAGPLEIIAGGGLTQEDVEKMLTLTVKDAHLAALFETMPDVAPTALQYPFWKEQLSVDCANLLQGKVVVK